jgi:hypothetical protein
MVDGPHVQVDRLHGAKRPLHLAEGFGVADGVFGGHDLRAEPATRDPPLDLLEFADRRRQEVLPRVCPARRQFRVATGDQALARIIGMRRLKQIAIIEEAELQGSPSTSVRIWTLSRAVIHRTPSTRAK